LVHPGGRLFGIEIRIHLTFFFLLMFVWAWKGHLGQHRRPPRLRVVGIISAA
jgi:hypothetical protein